jgi:hypothetical protein
MTDLIKISFAARALEVTPKTIYNWINDGSLSMPVDGYVSRTEVFLVYKEKIAKRQETSKWMLLNRVTRDKNGRFVELPPDPAG